MNPERNRSFSKAGRRGCAGCLSLTFISGITFGMALAVLAWVGGFFGLNRESLDADIHRAQQAFDQGNLDSVIDQTGRIWDAHPEQVEALALLVRGLIYRSYADYNHTTDRAKALAITGAAYERLPVDTEVMAAHAFALQVNGFSNEAARLAAYTLDQAPDQTLARLTLGLAYGGMGIHQSALLENQTAVANADQPVDAARALAISLGDMGRYQDAIAQLDQAINNNHHLLMLHFEKAEYAIHAGDVDTATAAFFRVLAYDANNVKARLRLCELSTSLRERAAAERYCTEVTELAPDWVEGWYRLGREYYLQGAFEQAQTAFHQCTTLSLDQRIPVAERQFECWYLQGQSAEIRGDCPALLSTYNEFRVMAASVDIPQTWTYPPEGPAICQS